LPVFGFWATPFTAAAFGLITTSKSAGDALPVRSRPDARTSIWPERIALTYAPEGNPKTKRL
jgi:hypothetical protein